jgi:zinc transporter ZupT
MSTKNQSGTKAITVTQVGWAASLLAIVGGMYGFFTGGPVNMIIGFIEWFIAGFILFYVCASFIVLLRK